MKASTLSSLVGLLILSSIAHAQMTTTVDRSENLSPTPVKVNFKNSTSAPIKMLWVNFSAGEQEYGTIPAGGEILQETGHGHLWRFKQDGRVIAAYQATQAANQTFSVTGQAQPVPAANQLLTGVWKDGDGYEIEIQQTGNIVVATARPEALRRWWDTGRGQLTGNQLAMVHSRSGTTTAREIGTVAADGSQIQWNNGTRWVKSPGADQQDEEIEDRGLPFVPPTNPHPTADWMGANYDLLKDKQLNEVKLPGTHNSGAYGLTRYGIGDDFDDISPDLNGKKLEFAKAAIGLGNSSPIVFTGILAPLAGLSSEAISKVFHDWCECQEKTVGEQLRDGIRSLDFRVCTDRRGELRICHGELGPKVSDVLGELASFARQHPTEIVIIRFTHFYPFDNTSEDSLHTKLTSAIQATIGPHVVGKEFNPLATLQQIWGSGKQIVVMYDKRKDLFWEVTMKSSYSYAKADWHRDKFKTETENYINRQFKDPSTPESGFNVLNCEVTTDEPGELIGRSIDPIGNYPGSVKNVAAQTNPVVLGWIRNEWRNKHLNIIQVDFYNRCSVVNLCKQLNGLPIPSGPLAIVTGETEWGKWKHAHEAIGEWAITAGLDAVNWAGEAGSDAVNWIEQAANDAVNWAEVLVNGEKVAAPKRGTTAANVPEGVRHYVITVFHVTNLDSGNDGSGDIELFGSVSVIPDGSFYTNGNSNQFLFNKRAGDRVILQTGASHSQTERKDFYIAESQVKGPSTQMVTILNLKQSVRVPGSHVKIVSRLVEHDDFDNDHMYGEQVQDLSGLPVGYYQEFKLPFQGEENERGQVYYAVSRVK